ncbi:MAG: phage recombination protein Bet [Rhodocyclaceae bacterium]|nr:phage recombination protein Bet [Rhodocyclaceae bacterium]
MNALAKTETTALSVMTEQDLMKVLQASLYPGAAPESIKMVLGYCRAAGLDPMQKPVHIVPMWDAKAGSMRDVVMPGVNLYRTQAMRSGECAGVSEPEFGNDVTETIGGAQITYPAWCRVTIKRRLPTGEIVNFTAREFWKENYAIKGGKEKSIAPNAMWTKRPYGQLAKCAEAQALRKAFPEIASASTADEMEGKPMRADEAPSPEFDYLDPAPIMAGVANIKTDDEGAKYWKDNAPKLAKQPADYAALKDAVIARRLAIKNEVKPDNNAPPVVTYASVMDKLLAAKNRDALDVAADWINAIEDGIQKSELTAKYEELQRTMEESQS